MSAFRKVDSPQPRAALGVLWRIDADAAHRPVLLVQSAVPGDWSALPDGWLLSAERKPIDTALEALRGGQVLRFLLRANATRKINTKTGPDGRKSNGQRVPLRSEKLALEWLRRHGESSGFALIEGPISRAIEVRLEGAHRGARRGGMVTIETVRFEGLLTVTDRQLLADAIRSGIGPQKSYGCGLLSLALPRACANGG